MVLRQCKKMTDISPSDSLTIKDAAKRLQDALSRLERKLVPMQDKISRLETQVQSGAAFEEDRARLASELDQAKAHAAEHSEREKEFTKLADESIKEIDLVMSQLRETLRQG